MQQTCKALMTTKKQPDISGSLCLRCSFFIMPRIRLYVMSFRESCSILIKLSKKNSNPMKFMLRFKDTGFLKQINMIAFILNSLT